MRLQDEQGYLSIVRAAQESVDFVENMPDYVHPCFATDHSQGARMYTKPVPSENPLNAWSHRVWTTPFSQATSPYG